VIEAETLLIALYVLMFYAYNRYPHFIAPEILLLLGIPWFVVANWGEFHLAIAVIGVVLAPIFNLTVIARHYDLMA